MSKLLQRIKHYSDGAGNYYGGLDIEDIAEIEHNEAKAKGFDHVRKILDELTSDEKTLKVAQSNNYVAGKINAFENVEILMDDYKFVSKKFESGESK